MKFDEVWKIAQNQNPKMAKGRAIMSTDNFRKAMKWAYNRGHEEGVSKKLFDGFFGGGK